MRRTDTLACMQPHTCECTRWHAWCTIATTIHHARIAQRERVRRPSPPIPPSHPPIRSPARTSTKGNAIYSFVSQHFPNIHCQRPTPTYRVVCLRLGAAGMRYRFERCVHAGHGGHGGAPCVDAICLRFRRCAHCLVSAVVGGASSAQQHKISTHNRSARSPNKFGVSTAAAAAAEHVD